MLLAPLSLASLARLMARVLSIDTDSDSDTESYRIAITPSGLLALVAANVAAIAGQQAAVLCTIDALWLGTDGGVLDGLAPGYPAQAEHYDRVHRQRRRGVALRRVQPHNINETQLAAGVCVQVGRGLTPTAAEAVRGASGGEPGVGRVSQASANARTDNTVTAA